jgi:hypothetical protein
MTTATARLNLALITLAQRHERPRCSDPVGARVAAAVQSPACPPVALAALSRQLVLLSKEISLIDARLEDEVAVHIPDEAWDGAV